MYKKKVRVFGPPNFSAYPVQKGEGIGSAFAKLFSGFRKFAPIAKKGIQKLANSKVTKDIGNTLLNQGVSAATDIAANLIEGKSGYSASEDAKKRLKQTRKEIADVLRGKKSHKADNSDEDKDPVIPLKKRRKVSIKTRKTQKKRKKNYSVYEDFEDV